MLPTKMKHLSPTNILLCIETMKRLLERHVKRNPHGSVLQLVSNRIHDTKENRSQLVSCWI
jgi:hypothetical protein